MMKNVLMVAYDFPPIGWSGAQRTAKFAKYLPDFGWEPLILTVNEQSIQKSDNPSDLSLLNELPESIKIYRSGYVGLSEFMHFFSEITGKNLHSNKDRVGSVKNRKSFVHTLKELMRPLIIPDPRIGWYPFAIRTGKQIFQHNRVDILYSTSPYPTAHLVAMFLAKKYKIPWVADFRDPWTRHLEAIHFSHRPFPFKQWEKALEKHVIQRAAQITIAWPGIRESLLADYEEHTQKIHLLYNGFDEQDFQDITPNTFSKFTIVHTGTFYKGRTPEALFRALDVLFRNQPTLRNDIQVVFVGKEEPFVKNLIEKNRLNDVVITVPYLPHKECLTYLLEADILFLNTMQNYVPGKVFEYVRSGKPILALVPKDSTIAEIVTSTQSGIVVDPSKTEKIQDMILEMYEQYQKGKLTLKRKDDSVIYQYERKHLTGKLGEIFNELVEKN